MKHSRYRLSLLALLPLFVLLGACSDFDELESRFQGSGHTGNLITLMLRS